MARTMQARGNALLNLRLSEMEGGLLGRTLITLVPNKGWPGEGKAGAGGTGVRMCNDVDLPLIMTKAD